MTIPSGGSGATIGAKRCSIQSASRSSASASAAGSASWMMRPGTSAWALVAGMPTRRPAAWAAASAASTTRRLPSRPTRTSGASAGGAASPDFRLTRSVDKVGRKSEMTRVIARLQFEIRAFAGAAADQLDKPARAADARNGERRRRQRRNAPARRGGRGLAEIGRLGLPPPAAQRDADRAGAFGGELKPPRSGHRQARDFADDGAESAVAQAFFKAGEDRLVVAALKIDDAIGLQAGLGERRREEIRPRDAPEHLALGAGGDAGCEQGRRGAIDRAVSAAGYFMQSAEWEAAARESRVQSATPKGKTDAARLCRPSICRTWARRDSRADGGRTVAGVLHRTDKRPCSLFVRFPSAQSQEPCRRSPSAALFEKMYRKG